MHCALPVLLLSAITLNAAEDLTVLPADGPVPPRKMLHTYLLKECAKRFAERREAVAKLQTLDDVHARRDSLRKDFIHALGGLPERTPLRPQITGTIQRDGFRIEKIIFESRPNHHVTANLYIPDGKGPFPVVLMPIGHSENGKASFQTSATLLARNGIAAFPYDPISQGERKQLLDEKGKPFIPSMTAEHSLIGVGAMLVGRCTASYRIWDGMRALDYLCSREDIDAKHIGCTGCSGGGTLTSYLMALDDRILAAAPSCYITSLERLFATRGPQDAEQNIPGQVDFHMDHADYILMRAPKPTLILACSKDFFDIDGTWTTFREAKQIYTKLGFPERVDILEADSTHGYPGAHREGMARFMSRWLLGKDRVILDEKVELVKDSELLCTRTGQVLEEFKGKSCFDLNREEAILLAAARRNVRPTRKAVRLIVPNPARQEVAVIRRDGYTINKLIYTTERGILVPCLLFQKNAADPLTIYLNGQGMAADGDVGGPIEKLVKSGRRVLAIDPRGIGETAPAVAVAEKRGSFGVDFTNAFLAIHLADPLPRQRISDVCSILLSMNAKEINDLQILGIGTMGAGALELGLMFDNISHVTVQQALVSRRNVVETPQSIDQLTNVELNFDYEYDLPSITRLIAPRKVTLRDTRDAAGKKLPKADVQKIYAEALKEHKGTLIIED